MTDARILERGYRRYEGPRRGTPAAVRSLSLHGLRRVLGLRRPARAKVMPVLVLVLAYLPSVVIVGLAVLVPDDLEPFGVVDSYGFVITAMVLFVAFVAPEALCPDRRYRTLGLYLASPLTRATYVLAKVLAVGAVLLLVTLGPPLLLLVALALVDDGPDGPVGVVTEVLRVGAAGVVLSGFLGLLGLAVSSFTDRRAFASVGIVVLTVAGGILAGVLYDDGAGVTWIPALIPHLQLAAEAALVIFGVGAQCPAFESDCTSREYIELAPWAIVGSTVAWTLVAGAILWWRYRRMEVG